MPRVLKGRSPLVPDLKGFGVQRSGTFSQRARSVCGYVLSGRTRWPGLKTRDPRSPRVFGRCGPLLSLVLFGWVSLPL
jgi:hypothetical protein